MMQCVKTIDMRMLKYIDKRCKSSLLDIIMPKITYLGNFGLVWVLISLLLLDNNKYRVEGFVLISTLCLTTIIGEGIIKHLVRRERPFIKGKDEHLLIAKPITYSFPSGHSASSFAAAVVFVVMNDWISFIAVALAALIAFSRIYLKVHYPLDVFCGILLGIMCSTIVVHVFSI